jgi:hypothetical protein
MSRSPHEAVSAPIDALTISRPETLVFRGFC